MIKKSVKLLLMLIGIFLAADGFIYGSMSVFGFGVFAELIIAAFIFFSGLYLDSVLSSKGFIRILSILFCICLAAVTLLSSYIYRFGKEDNATYREDVLIVLGAGLAGENITIPLKYRLDKALEYYEKNPESIIIVSGGMGYGETVTESSAMKKYLIEHGISPEKIIEENRASSTYENFMFSKEIADSLFPSDYKSVFATNTFHVLRSYKIAGTAGLNPTHLSSRIQWYSVPANYLRECAALIKYFLIKK